MQSIDCVSIDFQEVQLAEEGPAMATASGAAKSDVYGLWDTQVPLL